MHLLKHDADVYFCRRGEKKKQKLGGQKFHTESMVLNKGVQLNIQIGAMQM